MWFIHRVLLCDKNTLTLTASSHHAQGSTFVDQPIVVNQVANEQLGPNIANIGPITNQGGPGIAIAGPPTNQEGPSIANAGLPMNQDGLSIANGGPVTNQEGPSIANAGLNDQLGPNRPNLVNSGPPTNQEGPSIANAGSTDQLGPHVANQEVPSIANAPVNLTPDNAEDALQQTGLPDIIKVVPADQPKRPKVTTKVQASDEEADLTDKEKEKDVFQAGETPVEAPVEAISSPMSGPKTASAGPKPSGSKPIKISEPEVVDGWLPTKQIGRPRKQGRKQQRKQQEKQRQQKGNKLILWVDIKILP